MNVLSSLKHLILMLAMITCIMACTPHEVCLDALMIEIPDSDATLPSLEWQVTNVATGVTNSYTAPSNTITKSLSSTLKIELLGKDHDGGIKIMTFAGPGFTYTCEVNGVNQTITTSIMPSVADFSSLTSVALKDWKMERNDVVTDWCGGSVFVDGTLYNYGKVENFHGGIVESTLNITVVE